METTYEVTKKVKDTKLQMLTTWFEDLRMGEDESFDSFYNKLNEVIIGKFNLEEKMKDSKVVQKILRSLPESFRAKVTTIEEGKDLNESSSTVNISKEVKFVKAKELVVVTPIVEMTKVENKKNVADQRVLNKPRNQSVARSEARAKSLPRSQRGPRTNHVCHHCGLQGHTRPNCHKLRALTNASDQRSRGPRNDKRTWAIEPSKVRNGDHRMMDVMKMIGAFTNCLESFTRRSESPNSRT